MPDEYCDFPPINPAIFAEIAALLPEGHLKTYWEGLTEIHKLPKEDPIVVAVLAMGIMTIVARQVPGELEKLLRELEKLLKQAEISHNFKARFDQSETARRDAAREFLMLRTALENAKKIINRSVADITISIDSKVKQAMRDSSYFSRHPLGTLYIGGSLVGLGVLLEYLTAHFC